MGFFFFFFFSSRRRHTRYWRDWSSDVCSSDLADYATTDGGVWTDRARAGGHATRPAGGIDERDRRAPGGLAPHRAGAPQEHLREDRRAQPPRPRRQGVLLALRAATARQRAARARRASAARRAALMPVIVALERQTRN